MVLCFCRDAIQDAMSWAVANLTSMLSRAKMPCLSNFVSAPSCIAAAIFGTLMTGRRAAMRTGTQGLSPKSHVPCRGNSRCPDSRHAGSFVSAIQVKER